MKRALVVLIMGIADLVRFHLISNASTPSVNPQMLLMVVMDLGIAVMTAARR